VHVLFLFVDGVGIGGEDPAVNPLAAARMPVLRSLFGGEIPFSTDAASPDTRMVRLDATLGVEGLPQSGTGQTSLFTGVNAAALIGKHFGPHPYSSLRPLLASHSLFSRLVASGRRCAFANAFPGRFFRYIAEHPNRVTATTLSALGAGLPLAGAAELIAGSAVSADISGEGWKALGHPETPVITPAEAGERLAGLARRHALVLFEYWHTDRAGHAQVMADAVRVLEGFDEMLGGVLDAMDRATTLLVLTSDHGNVEDLSVKTHTRNPVPALFAGHRADEVSDSLLASSAGRPDLTHVAPALLRSLGV
jgi:hypothetical protein